MMSHFVEGIGDEILWILATVTLTCILYFAWKSTGISPTEYYVWLVRMRVNPNSNTFQILHMADADAHLFEQRLTADRDRLNEAANAQVGSNVALSELLQPNYSQSNSTLWHQSRSFNEIREPERSASDNMSAERLLQSNISEDDSDRSRSENPNGSVTSNVTNQSSSVEDTQLVSSVLPSVENNVVNLVNKSVPDNIQCMRADLSQVFNVFKNASLDTLNGNDMVEEDHEGSSEIKLKFLDDTQMVATTSLDATVGEFKRKYFYGSIVAGKIVRLIYRGQLLRDDSRSLSSYGIQDKCVLHCHVSSVPYAQTSSSDTASAHLNRTETQTYHGRSIEDNPADSYSLRLRNAAIRWFRVCYNFVMGPFPSRVENRDEVAAAAAAASRGLNNRTEAASIGMIFGHHLHIFFAVKFILLWTFVYVYPQYTNRLSMIILSFLTGFFATIMFTIRHDSNHRAEQSAM